MHRVLAAPLAVFFEFQFPLDKLFVLAGMIVDTFAGFALYPQ